MVAQSFHRVLKLNIVSTCAARDTNRVTRKTFGRLKKYDAPESYNFLKIYNLFIWQVCKLFYSLRVKLFLINPFGHKDIQEHYL